MPPPKDSVRSSRTTLEFGSSALVICRQPKCATPNLQAAGGRSQSNGSAPGKVNRNTAPRRFSASAHTRVTWHSKACSLANGASSFPAAGTGVDPRPEGHCPCRRETNPGQPILHSPEKRLKHLQMTNWCSIDERLYPASLLLANDAPSPSPSGCNALTMLINVDVVEIPLASGR
jgi:hypothetical protein